MHADSPPAPNTKTDLHPVGRFHSLLRYALKLHSTGAFDQAIKHYRAALVLQPHHGAIHQALAYLYQVRGDYENGVHHYRQALRHCEESEFLYNGLGICLEGTGRHEEAERCFRMATEIRQDYAEAWNNHGNLCRRLGDYGTALSSLSKAIRLLPKPPVYGNMALLLQETQRGREALAHFDRALARRPDQPQLQWNRSLTLLTHEQFENGWPAYEWGAKAGQRPSRNLPFARWQGEDLSHKRIVVLAEQGLGDEIMFGTCLPDIMAEAGHCIIETDRRLLPIYRRSFSGATVIARGNSDHRLSALYAPDYHVPVGSLPLYLRPDSRSFPRQHQLLYAEPLQRNKWRQRLDTLGEGLKVGISWEGGLADEGAKRSTCLRDWRPLLNQPGCHFINLQYRCQRRQVDELNRLLGIRLHDWPDTDHYQNIESLAGLIGELDLVISVSNATVHLAGALGAPTWTLVPFNTNWRWFQRRSDSLWYGSMRLFRQSRPGDWPGVLREVKEALEKRLSK